MKYVSIGENHLYSKLYAKGKKFVCRRVVVYVMPDYKSEKFRRANPDKRRINRIGLTVTKKLGGAVVRSRVKRIIREAYRLCDVELKLKTGFLIVIVARDAAVGSGMNDIRIELETAFEKLGMSRLKEQKPL